MDRARHFYEQILHLTPGSVFETGGKAWVEYEVGPHTLAITNTSADWKPSSNGGGVALEVEDFPETIAWLRGQNVQFNMDPYEFPGCHMALIADPDGNSICIHKRKPAQS